MNKLSSFMFGITAGIWICYFALEWRLSVDLSGATKAAIECRESRPRNQDCVMVYEFVPVKAGEEK